MLINNMTRLKKILLSLFDCVTESKMKEVLNVEEILGGSIVDRVSGSQYGYYETNYANMM